MTCRQCSHTTRCSLGSDALESGANTRAKVFTSSWHMDMMGGLPNELFTAANKVVLKRSKNGNSREKASWIGFDQLSHMYGDELVVCNIVPAWHQRNVQKRIFLAQNGCTN
jgi:hypothetical protein